MFCTGERDTAHKLLVYGTIHHTMKLLRVVRGLNSMGGNGSPAQFLCWCLPENVIILTEPAACGGRAHQPLRDTNLRKRGCLRGRRENPCSLAIGLMRMSAGGRIPSSSRPARSCGLDTPNGWHKKSQRKRRHTVNIMAVIVLRNCSGGWRTGGKRFCWAREHFKNMHNSP
jgi:hypothetical protein